MDAKPLCVLLAKMADPITGGGNLARARQGREDTPSTPSRSFLTGPEAGTGLLRIQPPV